MSETAPEIRALDATTVSRLRSSVTIVSVAQCVDELICNGIHGSVLSNTVTVYHAHLCPKALQKPIMT
jgi:hypothetical protein